MALLSQAAAVVVGAAGAAAPPYAVDQHPRAMTSTAQRPLSSSLAASPSPSPLGSSRIALKEMTQERSLRAFSSSAVSPQASAGFQPHAQGVRRRRSKRAALGSAAAAPASPPVASPTATAAGGSAAEETSTTAAPPAAVNGTAGSSTTAFAAAAAAVTELLPTDVCAADGGYGRVPDVEKTLSITIVGASGDLARKKIFPALFALFYEGCLPKSFQIFGYARSKMNDEQLRNVISSTLTCRIDKREECGDKIDTFLQRCFYQSGQYNSLEGFKQLDAKMRTLEGDKTASRLFYLSIPPNVFVDVARSVGLAASVDPDEHPGAGCFTRVIVEKPFGRDSESSAELTRGLAQYLSEDQIYRIDHYLGKELVENLLVLRFSNLVFEPLWSRQYIRNVQLIFSEDFGTDGRGGYFDNYGIIRDIMQNHLLQILTLFAMEPPVSLSADDIINEKVKVLRSMKEVRMEDVVVAQYKGHTSRSGTTYPGYTDDPTVPNTSITPTFAAAALFIDNARWDGVPFLMKAGKALHSRRAEIRVQFRHVPGNLYKSRFGTDLDQATNELVIRLQPDEAIYLKINNKVPGLGFRLDRSTLNLQYFDQYKKELPDAYERLLLDAIDGDKRLFIRADELERAWGLFTPLLKDLEEKKVSPELYPYGSRGPIGAHYLAAKYGVRWGDMGN